MPFSETDTYEHMTFDQVDCVEDIEDVAFYKCTFVNSNFQSRRLIDCSFDDCEFIRCNLSVIEIHSSVFTGVTFSDCKMVGVNWAGTGGFLSAVFEGCIMHNNVFVDMNLSKYRFTSCMLSESTFSNTKLRYSVFDDCDLSRCQFHQADLTGADFSTSCNYYMNAEVNTLSKTIFSLPEAVSLLGNLDIVLK